MADRPNHAAGQARKVAGGEVAFPDLDEINATGGPVRGEGDELFDAFCLALREQDTTGNGVEKHQDEFSGREGAGWPDYHALGMPLLFSAQIPFLNLAGPSTF